MPHTPTHDHRFGRTIIATVTAIVAITVYVLVFTELAFIELARAAVGEDRLKQIVIVLGVSGIAGSLLGAKFAAPSQNQRSVIYGFGACFVAAGVSLLARGMAGTFLAAVLAGSATGWTLVALALCLRPTVHLHRLGLVCGLGTGIAYLIGNQPALFTASPRAQAVAALVIAALGGIASLRLRGEPSKPSASLEFAPRGAAAWIALFIALVWLDSAAFYIIQHTPALRTQTWNSTLILQGNAFIHFWTAVLAGLALSHRQYAISIGLALVALIGACLILNGHSRYFPPARVLYTTGVSIYSTAIVYFAARSGRPWFSGMLFASAGCIGSAIGISVAQSQRHLPVWFLVAAGAVGVTSLVLRQTWIRKNTSSAAEVIHI